MSTSCARYLPSDKRFSDLEFAFDAGGMIRGAMNEGKSTPINVRIKGKNQQKAHTVAEAMQREIQSIDGVVDSASSSGSTIPNTFSTSIGQRRPTWVCRRGT